MALLGPLFRHLSQATVKISTVVHSSKTVVGVESVSRLTHVVDIGICSLLG